MSSIKSGSTLIFASCVIHRPLIFTMNYPLFYYGRSDSERSTGIVTSVHKHTHKDRHGGVAADVEGEIYTGNVHAYPTAFHNLSRHPES